MAKAEQDGRTEKPTPKRLKEARKEGRIAKSPELVSWVAIFLGLTMMQSTVVKAAHFLNTETTSMAKLMSAPDQNNALKFMASSIGQALMVVLPLTLTFMVISVVGHLTQVRLIFSTHAMKPSLKKINPISGAKRLFSPQSAFTAGKQFIKMLLIGGIAYLTVYKTMTSLTTNGPYSTGDIIHLVSKTVITFVREVAAIGIVMGLIDYFYQRRKVGDGLKMSKHEVKEEARQQDLPPQIKGKIRQKQRQLSRNRMMAAISKADVVIVNPVHIAIALKYNPARGAPRVVAKGAGFIAERIRDKADEHNVPMVQDIPLARALHRACDIDDEIPADLFQAVARALAFVFSLRDRGTGSGFHKMPGTPDLEDMEPLEQELAGV